MAQIIRLDPENHEVRINGSRRVLPQQLFLVYSTIHARTRSGRTASEQWIRRQVWGSRQVTGKAVKTAVHRIRQVLGPGAIRTQHGKGYVTS